MIIARRGGVVVFVIAAVVVGREAHRLDAVAPRSVYMLDEAVEFVAEHLPPRTQARLTPDELEQLLVPHAVAARQGPAAGQRDRPPQDIDHARGDRRGHARRLPARRGRPRAASRSLDDVDVVNVVDAHLAYFKAIGAVGPPAGLDDVIDS